MKTYMVRSTLFYYTVEAESPTKAWTIVHTDDPDNIATNREELRQQLLKLGYTTMQKTLVNGVFLIK